MTDELGLYLSRYQGKITDEAVGRMIAQRVRFVGLRLTSGAGYIDPVWEHNAAKLRDTEILLFPWHFTTTDDAGKQYKNFITQANKFDKWRLPPAQDCEAYTSVAGHVYSVSELQSMPRALWEYQLLRKADLKLVIGPEGDYLGEYRAYALSYPTEATVDAIGRQLRQWMKTQPLLAGFDESAIYTNESSGNKIFGLKAMARYLLWVANWHSAGKPPLEKPNKPAVWTGTPFYIWQDEIIDGAPYGIPGQVSHERWGPLFPFPGGEPEPPPPANEIKMTIEIDNQIYSGKLQEV